MVCGLYLSQNQDRQCTYNITLRRCRVTVLAVEKQQVLDTVRVYVVLRIQRGMRMRHNVIGGLPRSTVFFHILS